MRHFARGAFEAFSQVEHPSNDTFLANWSFNEMICPDNASVAKWLVPDSHPFLNKK